MDCVTECPDTAILGKVLAEVVRSSRSYPTIPDQADRDVDSRAPRWSKNRKYYEEGRERRGWKGAGSRVIIEPQ